MNENPSTKNFFDKFYFKCSLLPSSVYLCALHPYKLTPVGSSTQEENMAALSQ